MSLLKTARNPVGVLIVEDESIIATDIEERLENLGYRALAIAESGEEAVRLAFEHQPDIVLMDIRLKGGMDGIEAALGLRSRSVKAPVIFLTSHSDQGTLDRAGLSEPFGYLTKPFQERDLHASVEMALHRCRAEERVRKQQQRSVAALNNIGDAIITTDNAGRITYLNPAAEELTGWSMSEALARPWQNVFRLSKEGQEIAVDDPVVRAMKDGVTTNVKGEVTLLTLAGRTIAVDEIVAPLHDEVGKITGSVIVLRDASEVRALEEAMSKQNEQLSVLVRERTAELEKASRLMEACSARLRSANADLEAVTNSLSNDFRTLFRAIHETASQLEQDYGNDLRGGGNCLVQGVSENCRRTLRMIDGCLDLLRVGRQSARLQVVDMTALVNEVVTELRASQVWNRAEITVFLLPEAIGDLALLRRAWTGLIENALKFSERREPPRIEISGEESGGEWIYHIRDNGIGFESTSSNRLFGLFQRLHGEDDFPGCGVGLSIVQRIVFLHGGQIWAEAGPEQGAVFHFTLPAIIVERLP